MVTKKNNKNEKAFGIALVAGLLLMWFAIIYYNHKIENFTKTAKNNSEEITVKKGQVWVEFFNKDNPFEKTVIIRKKVIDIKNDYVLFVTGNDTSSESVSWFKCCSKLLK